MEKLDQIFEILGEQGEKLINRLDDLKDEVITRKDIFMANQELEEMFALYGKKMFLEKLDKIDTDDKNKRALYFSLTNDLKESEAEDINELDIYEQYNYICDTEKYLEASKEQEVNTSIGTEIGEIINKIDFDPENITKGIEQFKNIIKEKYGNDIKVYDFTDFDHQCEEEEKKEENKKPNINEKIKIYTDLYHNGDISEDTFIELIKNLTE